MILCLEPTSLQDLLKVLHCGGSFNVWPGVLFQFSCGCESCKEPSTLHTQICHVMYYVSDPKNLSSGMEQCGAWALEKVSSLGSNLVSVTDLKQIQNPHSLCCDFGGYKTFTTRWSLVRQQNSSLSPSLSPCLSSGDLSKGCSRRYRRFRDFSKAHFPGLQQVTIFFQCHDVKNENFDGIGEMLLNLSISHSSMSKNMT